MHMHMQKDQIFSTESVHRRDIPNELSKPCSLSVTWGYWGTAVKTFMVVMITAKYLWSDSALSYLP